LAFGNPHQWLSGHGFLISLEIKKSSPNGIGVQQVETSIPQGEPGDRLRFMNGKSERLFVCNRSIHLLVLCKAWYFDLGKLEQQKMMNPKLFA